MPRALTRTAYKIRLEQSDLEIMGGHLGDRIGGIKRPELPRPIRKLQ